MTRRHQGFLLHPPLLSLSPYRLNWWSHELLFEGGGSSGWLRSQSTTSGQNTVLQALLLQAGSSCSSSGRSTSLLQVRQAARTAIAALHHRHYPPRTLPVGPSRQQAASATPRILESGRVARFAHVHLSSLWTSPDSSIPSPSGALEIILSATGCPDGASSALTCLPPTAAPPP